MRVNRRAELADVEPLRPRSLDTRSPFQSDYEPVRPSAGRFPGRTDSTPVVVETSSGHSDSGSSNLISKAGQASFTSPNQSKNKATLKRGHAFSYAGLVLFTIVLYIRPGEFYPSPITASLALIVALGTLAFFLPTQLSLEGTLTWRPTEVNLLLMFCFTALLSIPLAINRFTAWQEFSGTFIRCVVIFIIIINSVRTRTRLQVLLFIALASGIWLSVVAINDFRLGLATVDGYRAGGRGSGIFGNTNDMALHVLTLLPIAIALMFGTRSVTRKLFLGACSAVMLAAIVLSYSRGAFLGLIVVLVFMAMKLGRRHRFGIVLAVLVLGGAVLLLAPDNYGGRLLSIFFPSFDRGDSADARKGELFRSLYVALRHPLLGIGMGNYQNEMSYRGQVTHNAYTQVAAEMGMAALACYTLFIVTPLRKLGQIERETFATRRNSHYYYLTVGLEASLLAYMVSSFFLSVAYSWYVYYLVAFAICLRRLYEAETGKEVVIESRKERKRKKVQGSLVVNEDRTVTA